MIRLQLFIHRQYENIKLVLQFVIIGLIIAAIVNSNLISDRLATQNRESTGEVLGRIDRETQRQSQEIRDQTRQLNQQFQALCFIVVQIAGENALRQIDPPLEEQCAALVKELKEENSINILMLRRVI